MELQIDQAEVMTEINTSLKILVVDDRSDNLIAMQSLLKDINTDIDYVETGNEALSLMLRHDYAIALIDVQMPDMDGFELVELMRMNPSTILIPVIFVTASSKDINYIHKGYEVGAIDYICKPIDSKVLMSKVKFFLDVFRAKEKIQHQLSDYKVYANAIIGSGYAKTSAKYSNTQKLPVQAEKNKAKILIVDDREENIFSLKKIIAKLSVDIESAMTGQEAVTMAGETEYAVILLDVQMPGMNGFEVSDAIKSTEKYKDIPIIFITAINKEDMHVFKGYKTGAVDYLFKPINSEILLAKVHVFIRLYQQRSILRSIVNEKENLLSEIQEKNEKLSFLSFHDPLTILPNRKGFLTMLDKTFLSAIKNNRRFAIIQVDIDHFTSINNMHGHQCGDLVLQEVANRLKASLRKYDYVARMGGDEFAIILDDIESIHSVGILAQKLIERFNESFQVDGHEIRIGLSAGIACYLGKEGVPQVQDIHELIQNADSAMYQAKHEGRGTYQYFVKEFTENHKQQLKLEHELRFAVDKQELVLFYQPKFCLKTKKIVGSEALVRWKHKEMGLIPPNLFIPLAEDTQMIIPIGQWITEQACLQLRSWLDQGYSDSKISINLSPVQLSDKNFENYLYALIKDLKLQPQSIEFELTETAIMSEHVTIAEKLNHLDEFGLVISIDDFGTGYSMLKHLKTLPISTLKIDMGFITNVDTNQADAMIVKSIIDLANNFKLNVIAEGVETQAHVDFLLAHGCNFGQGYYFSKPLPADAFTALLT